MGTKSSKDAHGAAGKGNLLLFDPDALHIITDKEHKLYDPRVEDAPDEELVASILYKGVVEAIIVWKDPESGKTCVLDGKHRVQAARLANKTLKKRGEPIKLVAATVRRGTLADVLGVMILANEGRTPPTPMGRAKSVERLLAAGYEEDQIAACLCVGRSSVKNYLALASCSAPVRQAVDAGKVPPTVAYKLSKLEPAEQKEQLGKMLEAASGVEGKRIRGRKMREASGELKMRTRRAVVVMQGRLRELGAPAAKTLAWLDWFLGGPEPEGVPAEEAKAAE